MSDIAAQEVFVDSGMLQRLLQPQHVIFLSFLIPDSLTVRVTNLLTDSLESLTDSLTSKLTLCSLDERVTGSLPNSLTYLLTCSCAHLFIYSCTHSLSQSRKSGSYSISVLFCSTLTSSEDGAAVSRRHLESRPRQDGGKGRRQPQLQQPQPKVLAAVAELETESSRAR